MTVAKSTPIPVTATQVTPEVFVATWSLSSSLREAVRVLQEFDPNFSVAEILDTTQEYREAGVNLKYLK